MKEGLEKDGEIYLLSLDSRTLSAGIIGFQERTILQEMIAYTGSDEVDLKYLMESRVNELIRLYAREISDVNNKMKLPVSQIKRLYEIKTSLLSHVGKPLRIESFAKAQHIGASTLRRLFKLYFNESVKSYFFRQRAEKGMYLVLHSEFSINEISTLTGYEDCSSFTRAFTKHFRHPPSFYRK